MKKRVFTALLCACIVFLCAACSDPQPTKPSKVPSESQPAPSATAAPTEPQQDDKVTYTVAVRDEEGNGIANVAVQLCDSACIPGFTGEDGTAVFRLPAGNYHASVTVMPDGYANSGEETEFYFEEGQTQLVIVLRAA